MKLIDGQPLWTFAARIARGGDGSGGSASGNSMGPSSYGPSSNEPSWGGFSLSSVTVGEDRGNQISAGIDSYMEALGDGGSTGAQAAAVSPTGGFSAGTSTPSATASRGGSANSLGPGTYGSAPSSASRAGSVNALGPATYGSASPTFSTGLFSSTPMAQQGNQMGSRVQDNPSYYTPGPLPAGGELGSTPAAVTGLFDPTPMAQQTGHLGSAPATESRSFFSQTPMMDQGSLVGSQPSYSNPSPMSVFSQTTPARSMDATSSAGALNAAGFGLFNPGAAPPDPLGLNVAPNNLARTGVDQVGSVAPVLAMIRSAEANKAQPYNSLVYGRGTPTTAPLTSMTIAEVQQMQRGMIGKGHASTAVGAYQMIAPTLERAVQALGIDPNTKFTPEVQDRLAAHLAYERGFQEYQAGKISAEQYANNLAREWAGLPTPSGASYYAGVNGNKATVSRAAIEEAVSRTSAMTSGPPSISVAARGTATPAPTQPPGVPPPMANIPTPPSRPSTPPGQVAQTYQNNPMPALAAPNAQPSTAFHRDVLPHVVDAAVGLIPGVGIVNAASGLMGQGSIGSWFAQNSSPASPEMDQGQDDGRPFDGFGDPPPSDEKESEKEPAKAFEDKYLAPVSKSRDLPTPYERFILNRSTYGRDARA